MPGGTSGIASVVTRAASTASAQGSLDLSRGHSSPRKAATTAPSRPSASGSAMKSPSSAPITVAMFHPM